MKGFPKKINTAQDIENCFELVKAGALDMSEFHCALKCIEERGFLNCPIVAISSDRKQATIRYCYEAVAGKAGNTEIVSVKHEADPNDSGEGMGGGFAYTVLTLKAALPAEETEIRIPVADPFVEMGMTQTRLNEIKEALNHEQAIH